MVVAGSQVVPLPAARCPLRRHEKRQEELRGSHRFRNRAANGIVPQRVGPTNLLSLSITVVPRRVTASPNRPRTTTRTIFSRLILTVDRSDRS